MQRTLEEIRRLRKKYQLTQKDLAVRSGVSQSLIAKIEAGKIDPTFTKTKLIFRALEQLREKEELKAKDVMYKKVNFVDVNDSLDDVIKIIKSKNISQLPVLSNENVCGLITENIILKKIMENPRKINYLKAGDIMEDSPPIVSLKAGLKTLLNLLQENQIVLVSEKGKVKGVVSRSDLLGRIE